MNGSTTAPVLSAISIAPVGKRAGTPKNGASMPLC